MKVIRGEGKRGPIRIKPKSLADAERATRLERFVNWQHERHMMNRILFGTPVPSKELLAEVRRTWMAAKMPIPPEIERWLNR